MKKCRVSVEWTFGKVCQIVKFTDSHRQNKWKRSQLGKVCIIAFLIANSSTCLYGSQSSKYYRVPSCKLGKYFRVEHLVEV